MQIDSAVGRSARFLARSTNMSDKLDPFDVVALEKAVNDSAVRVSTIWVSYLVFSVFLAIAAGNVTHLQLLLEEAVKLPVLNIDLPLVGFFVLAPILFIAFHAYVLIQVVLLARTASVYNEAVERSVKIRSDNARIRQRLTNTLFAQIFAGSPRERERLLGWILRFVAWITLAVAPVFVLLTLEMKFLAYHSLLITWAHRAFISIDLAAVLLLWPLALEPQRDIAWRRLTDHRRTIVAASFMIGFAFGIVLLSIIPMSFPTEAHANWTRYVAPLARFSAPCAITRVFFPLSFRRALIACFCQAKISWIAISWLESSVIRRKKDCSRTKANERESFWGVT